MDDETRWKLHIVYSGRGDAMYIEYPTGVNEQSLMIMDGGPATYGPRSHGNTSTAPYWKYFFSAGRQIWEQGLRKPRPFKPSNVIASHAHEDHVGGILALIQAWRDGDSAIDFDGAVYLPAQQTFGDYHIKRFIDLLTNERWNQKDEKDPEPRAFKIYQPQTGEIGNSFNIEYPGTAGLAVFSRRAIAGTVKTVAHFQTVSELTDNLNYKSILLNTRFDTVHNANGEGEALFTGDSSGWIIKQQVARIRNDAGGNIPHYSVYKIQHHGSGIDCRLDNKKDPLPNVLVKETAILAFLEYEDPNGTTTSYREKFFAGRPVEDQYRPQGLRLMRGKALELLQTSEIDELQALTTIDEARILFRDRHRSHQLNRLGLDTKDLPLIDIPESVINSIWLSLRTYAAEQRNHWKTTGNEDFFFESKKDRKWLDWFVQWMSDRQDVVKDTMWYKYWQAYYGCVSIRDFFKSFTADTYVVSANYTQHGHPTPNTIFGLAWALLELDRTAELFLTSGYSLYVDELIRLTEAYSTSRNLAFDTTFKKLFYHSSDDANTPGTGALTIRYMNANIYMSINLKAGAVNPPTGAPNGQSRGLTNFTTVDFRTFVSDSTLERHSKLETQSRGVLKLKPFGDEIWQIFRTQLAHKEWILQLERVGTAYRPLPVRKDQLQEDQALSALRVQEAWEVSGAGAGHVLLTNAAGHTCAVRFVTAKGKEWRLQWRSLNLCITKSWDFEWLPDEEIEFQKKSPLVLFNASVAANPAVLYQHQKQQLMAMNSIANNFDALISTPRIRMISNTAGGSRALVMPSVIMSEAEQQLPLADITAFLDIAKSLNQFLQDSAASSVLKMTTKEALVSLISQRNLDRLGYRAKYQQSVLDYPVDVEQSLAAYTDSIVATEVSGARLVLSPPQGSKIAIDGENLDVTNSELWLSWKADGTLVSVIFVRTADGEILRAPKSAMAAKGDPPTLAKILVGMGFKDQLEQGLTLASLLAIVFRDAQKAATLLSFRIPAVFLTAGLDTLVPDPYASTGKARIGITGKTGLDMVEIVCKPPPGETKDWDPMLQLGLIEAQVQNVKIIVTDVGTKVETITVKGEASLKMGDFHATASIEARLPATANEEMEITLTLGGDTPLSDACNLLPNKPDLFAMDVPLSKGPKALTQNGEPDLSPEDKKQTTTQTLQKLGSLKTEQVGITLRQPVRSANHYVVKEIFLAANLDGWKDYLPVKFPKELLAPEIRVMVVDPVGEFRAVAVHIKTALTLKLRDGDETMDIEFSAAPLVLAGDYEYRVCVAARKKGVSVFDVIDKIGMAVGQADLLAGVPILEQILNLMYIKKVSVAVIADSQKKGFEFGDWMLQLGVPKLILLPNGKLELQDVDVTIMESYRELSAVVTGVVYFPDVSAGVRLTIRTPKENVPGSLEIDCTRPLGLKEVYGALELPDISQIPVIREMFGVMLDSAYFTITNANTGDKQGFSILTARCNFTYENLDLGILKINYLWVSIGYSAAQKLDDGEDQHKHSFALQATIAEGSLGSIFTYSTVDDKITARLHSLKDISIAATVDLLLSENFRQYNILHSILGGLGLDQAELHMGLGKGHPISYFVLEVSQKKNAGGQGGDTGTLTFSSGMILQSLKVEYRNPVDNSKPEGGDVADENPALPSPEKEKDGSNGDEKPQEPQTGTADQSAGNDGDDNTDDAVAPTQEPDTPPVEPGPATTLDIKARVDSGLTQADVEINCMSRDGEKTAAITITPQEGDRVVRSILGLLGFGDEADSVKKGIPQDAPDCFDVGITHIGGQVAVVDGKLEFRSFEFVAQSPRTGAGLSPWTYTVFNGPPEIKLLELALLVKYRAKGISSSSSSKKEQDKEPEGLSGTLSAIFEVNQDVRFVVAYLHNIPGLGGSSAFVGSTLDTKTTQVSELATLLGMDGTYALPKTKNENQNEEGWRVKQLSAVFIPKKYIEVTASVTAQCSNAIGGVDLSLEELKALLRIDSRPVEEISEKEEGRPRSKRLAAKKKASSDNKKPQDSADEKPATSYEMWLAGKLRLKGLVAAEAWLYIKTDEDTVLTAVVKKDEVAPSVSLDQLAETVATSNEQQDTVESWDKIVPKGFQPLAVGETGVSLYANFTQPKLILAAQIGSQASALLLVKTEEEKDNKKKNLYMVSLVASDVASLWEPLRQTVREQFPILNVAAHIQGYKSTVKDIKKDLMLVSADADGQDQQQQQQHQQATTTSAGVLAVLQGLKEDTVIQSGAWFLASVDLSRDKSGAMKDVLTLDVSDTARTASTVTVFARLVEGATLYQISVQNLTLFGGVVTINNGTGTYEPKPKDPSLTPYFDVDADLYLRLDDTHTLQFMVKLSLFAHKTRFQVQGAQTEQTIANPLPGMFNVSLTAVGVSGSSTKDPKTGTVKRDWVLSGRARFGSAADAKEPTASLMFADGVPRVAVLKYSTEAGKKLNMARIFDDVVAPNPPPAESSSVATWPAEEVDLLEFDGAVFTYACADEGKNVVSIEDIAYPDGLNLTAQLHVFGKPFDISALFPRNRSGVKLTGTYTNVEGIDLGFARLIRPSIGIDTTATTGRSLAFTTGTDLELFGESGFRLDLTYTPAKDPKARYFEGTASYKPAKEPASDSLMASSFGHSLTVRYCDGHWSFNHWSLGLDLSDALSFLDAIEKASYKDNKCGALVDLLAKGVKEVVKTKFSLVLGLPENKAEARPQGEFCFTLTWKYTLSVVGKANLVTIEGDPKEPMKVKVALKGPFTLGNLVDKVWETLTRADNWEELGRAILQDADKLSALMLLLAAEYFGKETVKGLLCRKAKSENVEKRGRKLHNEERKQLEDKLEKVKDGLKEVGEIIDISAAVTGVTAIGSFITAFGPEILALLTARTMERLLLDSLDDEDEKRKMEAKVKKLQDELAALQARQQLLEDQIADGLMLTKPPTAIFQAGNDEESTILVRWGDHPPQPWGNALDLENFREPAVLTWDVRAGIAEKDHVGADWPSMGWEFPGCDTQQGTLQLDEFCHRRRVTVWVRARLETQGRVFWARNWAVVDAVHDPWLRAPLGLTLTVRGDDVVVGLPPADGVAAGDFSIELVGYAGDSSTTQGPEVVVYHQLFSALDPGPQEVLIAINALPAQTAGSATFNFLRARARQVARQAAWKPKQHDSPAAVSTEGLTVLPALAGLVARMEGRAVLAQWYEASGFSPAPNFVVTVERLWDGGVAATASDRSTPKSRHSVRLSMAAADVRQGDRVRVLVRTIATPTTVRLAARQELTIAYPPTLRITAADYDAALSVLSVRVASDQVFDHPPASFKLTLVAGTTSPAVFLGTFSARTVWERTAVIRAEVPVASLQTEPARLRISLGDNKASESEGFPLVLPPKSSSSSSMALGTTRLTPTDDEGSTWCLTWTDAAGPEDALMVVRVEDPVSHALLAAPPAVPVAQGSVQFDCRLVAGSTVGVFRLIKSGAVTGPHLREVVGVNERPV
ncbi:hypothetical protein ASPZODRAFT_127936 [Penicilliopsis zonata CBS 506.65]|uniref:Uncharacterized protein n=1 Tax=Penicilliopsis zonata CBS 506.65 TaxID=1073090 RepID=A0A1L9SX78_9EURO|nr:hypothetical protein ASPZODRAFT_127936 [Penicilliopsis zonata CBS 506.65]OJJ51802.1 hypothetical protein ASPZODRAFT_127936 [Penicilliopsis zonata CBS 506.65]